MGLEKKKKTDKLNGLPKTAVTKLICSVFSWFNLVSVMFFLFFFILKKPDFPRLDPSFKQSNQIKIVSYSTF